MKMLSGRIFSRFVSFMLGLLYFVSSFAGFTFGREKLPEPTLAAPLWSPWVHQHWVWENVGTQDSSRALVHGYLERDIPVGATIIDHPWDRGIGSFLPCPQRYPDLAELIEHYHNNGVRVLMWGTCMINEDAPNFQEGKDKGYYVGFGQTVKWWNGRGAFVDYTNPEAVEWFHRQMDNVLEMGIDGWKVDGADPYIMLVVPPAGKNDPYITWKEYRSLFYRDFFEYTREKLGNDRVISARPVDDLPFGVGLPLVFTTKDINFAGWVGDEDNDWGGLRTALNDMMASARFNFVSYGSDIGGFRSDGNRYKDVFIRWAQLGAFCPVMENGGNGTHEPWLYDEETADIYRKFAYLHTELIPYIYSSAAYSYELEKPTMRPTAGTYQYFLGDDILVAPIFEEGSERIVIFPPGEWIYMFDQSKVYTAGVRKLTFPMDEYPVFIRKGAIIPMEVENGITGFGSELSKGYTTVTVYPQKGEKKFGLYEEGKKGTMLTYGKGDGSLRLISGATERSLLWSVRGENLPVSVKDAAGNAIPRAASMAELVTMPAGCFADGDITWYAVKNARNGAEIYIRY